MTNQLTNQSLTRPGRTRRRLRMLLAVLVAFSLVAAACGDDDDDASNEVTATDEETPTSEPDEPDEQTDADDASDDMDDGDMDDTDGDGAPAAITNGRGVTDDTIKFGAVIDESGPFALLSRPIRAGFEARIAQANAEGGVHGRQIELIVLDSGSDPTITLQSFRQLWEEDQVAGIYVLTAGPAPYDYIDDNRIPTTLLVGDYDSFSSRHPTVFPTGAITALWNLQADWAVVNVLGRVPRVVAVTHTPAQEPLLPLVEETWMLLGAEEVIFDPFPSPTDPCDALVLKYRDAGVEYWDQHATSFLTCIPAQLAIGWSPPLGQGGPSTSSIDLASVIGQPMADLGVIAGAPTWLADGRPTFTEPSEAHVRYVEAMETYRPDYTGDLNDFSPQIAFIAANWFIDGMAGGAEITGELGPESLIEWSHTVENWDPGLAPPVRSMAPDCKTGNDATIWGLWTWDEAEGRLVMEPFAPGPGEPMITSEFLGERVSDCFLTELADSVVGG